MRFTYPGDETPPGYAPTLDTVLEWIDEQIDWHHDREDITGTGHANEHMIAEDMLKRIRWGIQLAVLPPTHPGPDDERSALIARMDEMQQRLDRVQKAFEQQADDLIPRAIIGTRYAVAVDTLMTRHPRK